MRSAEQVRVRASIVPGSYTAATPQAGPKRNPRSRYRLFLLPSASVAPHRTFKRNRVQIAIVIMDEFFGKHRSCGRSAKYHPTILDSVELPIDHQRPTENSRCTSCSDPVDAQSERSSDDQSEEWPR